MQLVEQGRLDLHAPITECIPELSFAEPWKAGDLTLHNLLANAGAMPDPYIDFSLMPQVHDIPAWDLDLTGWARRLGTMHLMARPGSFWNYSSPNFSIAGLAVERVTGMGWEDYVVEKLYRPAGMNVATFDPGAVVASGNYAVGYYQGRFFEPADYQRPYAAPGGGAFTTPTELISWVTQLMDDGGEILAPESVAAMTTRHYKAEGLPWAQRSGYGYGIFLEDFRRIKAPSQAVTVFQHSGNGRGYSTELYWLPEQGFAIAILINQYGTMRGTVDCALRQLAGVERAPPPAVANLPSTWERYAGSYAMQDMVGYRWTAHVEKSGNRLTIQQPDWLLLPVVNEAIPEPVAMTYRFLDTFAYRYDAEQIITFEPGGADPKHSGWLRSQRLVGQRLGYLPARLDIEGRGCATVEMESAHAVERPRVAAYGLSEQERWTDQPIAQEDPEDPSSSGFRVDLAADGPLGYLGAWLSKEENDTLGLYLMQDQNGDDEFAWPGELVDRLTGYTGQGLFVAARAKPGPYQLWVHGQRVVGLDSRFRLDLVAVGGRQLRVEGLPERLIVGKTASFEVCANPEPGGNGDRVGLIEIDFGVPGALGRVPVYWRPGEPLTSPRTLQFPWLSRSAGTVR
ncbi:MAG: beta-lactamase family protein [Ardenticatenia bacterium]|nr:beta-lactamase family protein [Ardenticatenia bacterium]